MYEQTLYKILKDHVKPKVIKRTNRYKKWEYGYNEEHDMVVISKTGQIGEIYEIQDLKIALPKAENVHTFEEDRWKHTEYPKELSKIKSVFDWEDEQPFSSTTSPVGVFSHRSRSSLTPSPSVSF